jgi:hypothetical protein
MRLNKLLNNDNDENIAKKRYINYLMNDSIKDYLSDKYTNQFNTIVFDFRKKYLEYYLAINYCKFDYLDFNKKCLKEFEKCLKLEDSNND